MEKNQEKKDGRRTDSVTKFGKKHSKIVFLTTLSTQINLALKLLLFKHCLYALLFVCIRDEIAVTFM